ncbi:MAG: SH3 domain-containing protein [Pseudomonadota bacterium]
MKSYVWLTFAFMGWGYYEMSGGADFAPEQRVIAEAEVVQEEPDLVTRDQTVTLLSVSASNVEPSPQAEVSEVVEVAAQPAPTPESEPAVVEVAAPAAPEPVLEPAIDLREVAGSRVNMRMGPGTNYDVITTLNGGTQIEVLSVDATGWANIRTMDLGIEGWMAERLLTD